MKFIPIMFGALLIAGSAHAEAAGPNDVTITDTTDYRNCLGDIINH
jgi:hypothetical protein